MNNTSSFEMTAEEFLAAQDKKRLDDEKREAAQVEWNRAYQDFVARRDENSRREREERLGLRKTRTRKGVAETNTDLVVELIGDKWLAFATLFEGMPAMDVQRHLAARARAFLPESRQAQTAQALIREAQQRVTRRDELAEGAL